MAVAIVRPVPRRRLPGKGLLLFGLAVLSAAAVAMTLMFAWMSSEKEQTQFVLGSADDYDVGSVTRITEGKFYLVRVSETEFVALSWLDPGRGCTVPWRTSGQYAGYFRSPCTGSLFDKEGNRVWGPAPHGLDRYGILFLFGDTASHSYRPGSSISVDTSRYTCGLGDQSVPCYRQPAAVSP